MTGNVKSVTTAPGAGPYIYTYLQNWIFNLEQYIFNHKSNLQMSMSISPPAWVLAWSYTMYMNLQALTQVLISMFNYTSVRMHAWILYMHAYTQMHKQTYILHSAIYTHIHGYTQIHEYIHIQGTNEDHFRTIRTSKIPTYIKNL